MREQPTKIQTGKSKKIMLCIIAAALLLLTGFTVWRVVFYTPPFVPPEFDESAVQGIPTPEESLAYAEISAENGFSFSLAGTMYQQADGSLVLYFTNPEESGYNLLCEIVNESGTILYRSGAIRSGEYVERLYPKTKFKNEAMKITLRVYAYEPDTWYSMGTITLDNMLQAY